MTEKNTGPGEGINAPQASINAPEARITAPRASITVPHESTTEEEESWLMESRIVWAPLLLVGVGWWCFFHYPHSEDGTFYATAAAVIATLYVAIALGVFNTKESAGSKMTFEHWVYMIAGSAGLMASVRALSTGKVHHIWQTELLITLTVVGVVAAILLVAERLVSWQVGGQRKAIPWTVALLIAVIGLVIFP